MSTFPSTVITGSTVTDSSGVVYVFSEGEYRFPLIPAGDYILKVEPPNGYKWPSLVSDENLNKLNNGAFIITIGSRGETFNVPHDSLPIKIDIPLDPVNLTALYLTKEAAKETISLGEFLRYKLTLENISLYNINNVVVKDNLPLGFKYKSGSTKVNGTQIQDPIISADGRTLEYFLGNLATNSKIVITYVVEIAAGAKFGNSQNVAFAIGDGGMNSNTAKAEVLVKDDLFQTKSFIIGKVAIGCKNVEQDTKPEIKIEKEIEYIKKEEKGSLSAQLFSSISEKDSIYNFINRINLRNSDLGVSNVRVIIKVPDGMRYQSGSSSFGDKPIEPQIIQGSELTYKLGDLPAGFNGDLTFLTMLPKTQKDTELTTKASVIFDTENEKDLIIDGLDTVYKLTRKSEATTVPPIVIRPNFSSGSAILTEEDKLRLDDLISRLKDYKIKSIEVIGHTDNQKMGQRLKSTYPDNYALSKARAESVISYLMRFLDLSPATLRTVGKGEDEPVVPNTNEYNMSINRRVEINIIAEKVNNFYQVLPLVEKSKIKNKEFVTTKIEKRETIKEVQNKKKEEKVDNFGEGVPGIRIYMEDGTYVITDKNGMYHFEGIKPGAHVLQLDKKTIPEGYEAVLYEDNTRFAGTPYSRFVDIQGGTVWRADFYLCKKPKEEKKPLEVTTDKLVEKTTVVKKGTLKTSLISSLVDNLNEKNIRYKLPLNVEALGVSNVRVIIKVPDGMRYQSGSSSFGDKPIEPQIIQGSELTYKLGDLPAGFNGDLTFLTMLPKTQKDTELTTKASVIFDTENEKDLIIDGLDTVYKLTRKSEATTVPPIVIRPNFSSGSAILTEEDKLRLDDLISRLKDYKIKSIEVIGHTDNQKMGQRLKSTYPDNYALSKARAESVISYLMRFLDLSPATLRTVGKGEDEPVVPNTNEYNMSINRRVEINIIAEKVNNFYQVLPIKEKNEDKYLKFIKTETVKEEVTKLEKKTSQTEKNEQSNKREIKSISDLTQEWIERERPGFEFVLPKDGYYPPLPYLDIAIKYDPSSKLRLFINGKEVEDIFVDSTRKNSMLLTGLKIWSGVNLTEGDNVLEAIEYDAKGKESRRIKKIVHYSGPPVTLKLVPEKSRLIADGKNPPVIAVKLLDKDGHPARENVVGEYTILPPYMPFNVLKDLQADPLTKSTKAYSNYIVKEEGITYIELAPTSQTGEVTIKFNLISGEKELKVWLKPEKRDWILVGLAEGTLGMNSSSGNKNNFSLSGIKDGWSTDGRLAFFAKGMLDDNWLLTLSYDSDRTGYRGNNRLFGTIEPSKYYTLYGDSTNQQYEAQSSKPLYVKLERDRFYALFGDFQSGLESTELSKYTRSLTGLKSELRGNILDFNLFIADTNQLFMREELRGDGTSGLYKLSGKNIVINSEKITIEVRDRFKSEVKISSKTLTRFIDYNINYDTGTIFFKSPVSPYDENFNPQYILVEYELFDMSKTVLNYGGRGAIKLWDRKLEIGASYIHEEAIGKDGNLLGIDVKVNISEKTQFKAEIAETDVNNGGQNITGKAYLTELTHKSDKLRGKIYFRELEKDFGLGQQNISELGTRKMGLTTNYYLTQNLDLGTEILRQYNLTDNNRRDLAEIITTYNSKKYELKLGLRHAEDTLANGDRLYSDQLMAGGAVRLLDEKLTLKVHREQSVDGNKNVDFPTRTKFGADYRLNQKVVFFAEHEILDGKNVETEMSRIGMKSNLWQGGQLNSTIEQQHSENGTRIFSVMGLQQTWQLNEKWSLTGGLDRSDTIKKATYTVNGNTFSAGSEGDFTAVNLGVGYKEKFWGANSRIEYRDGKEQDKAGIYTSIYSEVKEGLGIGSSLQIFDTKTHSSEQIFADLKFGLVYRPKISRWTVLDKLDIIFDSLRSIEDRYKSLRFINVVNLNYKDSKKLQFSIQYGAKYVTESIDDKDYKGYTDVIGIEGRYDIKNNWEIGLRVKLLHSWNANQYKYLFGPMIGYTPKKNIWVSLGYNLSGFVDRDFSKSDYTAHGIFFNFRLKFDKESTKNAIRWFLTSPTN